MLYSLGSKNIIIIIIICIIIILIYLLICYNNTLFFIIIKVNVGSHSRDYIHVTSLRVSSMYLH